jgi:hypothetical protein
MLLTDVKCITKQQYSSDLWKLLPLSFKAKRNCIVDKSLKIIQLIIKEGVRLILDNIGIVGFLFFGRIPVDSSHFSLHFDSIFILNVLKRSLILANGQTGGQKKNVLLAGRNAVNVICSAPHFSTVSRSIKSRTGVIIVTKTSKLSHLPAIQT